jgi:hypothetical protein
MSGFRLVCLPLRKPIKALPQNLTRAEAVCVDKEPKDENPQRRSALQPILDRECISPPDFQQNDVVSAERGGGGGEANDDPLSQG